MVSPLAEGLFPELRVVVAPLSGDLFSEPFRPWELFVGISEFYLSHHQSLVVSVELVDLESAFASGYEPSCFVDDAAFAEGEERRSVFLGYGIFKLMP